VVSGRRTLIERIVVGIVSASIAIIFVVATKPWQARLPRDSAPVHHTSQTSPTPR
jgi:hypothetical protein